MYFKTGMTVRVNKDISRLDEAQREHCRQTGTVPVFASYAQEGEIGTVVEVFITEQSVLHYASVHHAKVKINNQIKTFRLTSLEII